MMNTFFWKVSSGDRSNILPSSPSSDSVARRRGLFKEKIISRKKSQNPF